MSRAEPMSIYERVHHYTRTFRLLTPAQTRRAKKKERRLDKRAQQGGGR